MAPLTFRHRAPRPN